MRRPLQPGEIASKLCGIAVSFEGPRTDYLCPTLPDRAKVDENTGSREAGLFLELADRGVEWRFSLYVLSFGDRPRSQILLCPERAARMDEKDFEPLFRLAIEDESRAMF